MIKLAAILAQAWGFSSLLLCTAWKNPKIITRADVGSAALSTVQLYNGHMKEHSTISKRLSGLQR